MKILKWLQSEYAKLKITIREKLVITLLNNDYRVNFDLQN